MTQTELEQLNQVMGEVYANFCTKVGEGRRLDPAQTEAVARGRVWSGAAAARNGLVDELGGMARAVELAREKARLRPGQEHELALYSGLRGLMGMRELIGMRTAASAEAHWVTGALAQIAGLPEQWFPALAKLLSRTGASLLCPWF
jgi:ClpP class serine protease